MRTTTSTNAFENLNTYEEFAAAARQMGGHVVSMMKRDGENEWTVEGDMNAAYDMAEYWMNRGAEVYGKDDLGLFLDNAQAMIDGIEEDDREAFLAEQNAVAEAIRTQHEGEILVMMPDREAFTTPRFVTGYRDEDNSVMYRLGIVAE